MLEDPQYDEFTPKPQSRFWRWTLIGWLFIIGIFGTGLVYCTSEARAQGMKEEAVLLVASPTLQGPFRGTVIIATPTGGGTHLGFILNRPSTQKMAEIFPDHPPSRAVTDPVYLGGFDAGEALFAIYRSRRAKSPKSMQIVPGVWMAYEALTIDAIIESTPNEARYYAGVIAWGVGQLREELKKGFFTTRPADPALLFLPDTSGLLERLTPKGQQTSLPAPAGG